MGGPAQSCGAIVNGIGLGRCAGMVGAILSRQDLDMDAQIAKCEGKAPGLATDLSVYGDWAPADTREATATLLGGDP